MENWCNVMPKLVFFENFENWKFHSILDLKHFHLKIFDIMTKAFELVKGIQNTFHIFNHRIKNWDWNIDFHKINVLMPSEIQLQRTRIQ